MFDVHVKMKTSVQREKEINGATKTRRHVLTPHVDSKTVYVCPKLSWEFKFIPQEKKRFQSWDNSGSEKNNKINNFYWFMHFADTEKFDFNVALIRFIDLIPVEKQCVRH